jgi:hypothetical protein
MRNIKVLLILKFNKDKTSIKRNKILRFQQNLKRKLLSLMTTKKIFNIIQEQRKNKSFKDKCCHHLEKYKKNKNKKQILKSQ